MSSLRDQIAAVIDDGWPRAGGDALADPIETLLEGIAAMKASDKRLEQLVLKLIDEKNQAEAAIERTRATCADIEKAAHQLFGDSQHHSTQLARANGMIHAVNRIREALDQPASKRQ